MFHQGGGVHQPAYAEFDGADVAPTDDGTQDTYLQPGQTAFAPTAFSTSSVVEDALAPPRPRRPSQEIAPLTGEPTAHAMYDTEDDFIDPVFVRTSSAAIASPDDDLPPPPRPPK